MRLAGEPVEHLGLGGGEGQLAVLVLAVEAEQPRSEHLKVGGGGSPARDEGAGPARGPDAAAENDLALPLRETLGKVGELRCAKQAVR